MNFYKHWIGDYMRDTAHLTLTENGAYRVLLDHYYSTERPLPADLAALSRICRAETKEEKKAVANVVSGYFPLGEDGLRHNKRADAEIAARLHQVLVNREIGKRGGRPRQNRTETESVSEHEPNRNPSHSQSNTKEAQQAAPDPVWGLGLQVLTAASTPEADARRFIGMCLSTHTPEAVLEALRAADGKADPRAYVRGVLKQTPRKSEPRKAAFPL